MTQASLVSAAFDANSENRRCAHQAHSTLQDLDGLPHQDPCWREAASFLESKAGPDDALLAPDEFAERFPNVYAYAAPRLDPSIRYDWIIVHKGFCHRLDTVFLNSVLLSLPAVLANDVFVVFTNRPGLPTLSRDSPHLLSLRSIVRNFTWGDAAQADPDAAIRPLNFSALDVDGVRQAMNSRYSRDGHDEFGGYEHPHEWDRVRFHEVDRLFFKLLGDVTGQEVLEIGCGIGRNTRFFAEAASYLGTDLSDVAIAKVGQRGFDSARFQFAAMDAMDLSLPDSRFDLVFGAEIIEHVQDADKLLREVHRVLKPGGRFLFNSANRDSLHLRVLRSLGHPELRSTHEHFREFGYAEMRDILQAHSFDLEAAEGVFLHPYLSLPGIDDQVRSCTLDDPAIVEALREIGNRAGPEFGFEFMISARKR